MASYYQVKIRYQKEDDTGRLKTFNETYLFDALSYTEAEAKGYKQLSELHGDFQVVSITKIKLSDLFGDGSEDYWYKVKTVYYSVDENSGKEKKVSQIMLINAGSVQKALVSIEENLKTMLVPYEIEGINLTQIIEFYPHFSKEEPELV